MAENPGTFGTDLDRRLTVTVPVKAGTHTLWATTVLKSHAVARRPDQAVPADHRRRPRHHGRSVGGPPDDRRSVRAATGSGDTASRRKIFVCHPRLGRRACTSKATAAPRTKTRAPRASCPRSHGSPIASPWTSTTVATLMDFYRRGRAGVTGGSPSIAASSRRCSSSSRARNSWSASKATRRTLPRAQAYRLDDLALASRLSFFLWSSLPDDQLLTLASAGQVEGAGGARAAGHAACWPTRVPDARSPTSPSSGCTCAI